MLSYIMLTIFILLFIILFIVVYLYKIKKDMCKNCLPNPCPLGTLLSSCVFYTGETLSHLGINTNDTIESALKKINSFYALGTSAQAGSHISLVGNSGNTIINALPFTLQEVLTAGNISNKDIYLNDKSFVAKHADPLNEEEAILSPGQLALMTNTSENQAILRADLVTEYRNFQFPDKSGTLALTSDIPQSLLATISQSGTLAPVLTILYNTTGKTFTTHRTSSGSYYITPNSNFIITDLKQVIGFIQLRATNASIDTATIAVFNNNIIIRTSGDDVLNNTSIEIKIFP